MKKIVTFILVFFIMFNSVKADNYIIPDDAIRIRIIANSNSKYDQEVKLKVKEMLELKMFNLLKDIKGVDEARKVINDKLWDINNDIKNLLDEEKYSLEYKINYGKNYFPKKEYKGVTYNEGYYESLVVTLGKGEGNNWWCVLFPPLCLMEAEESDKVEYKFFVQELFEKYFN